LQVLVAFGVEILIEHGKLTWILEQLLGKLFAQHNIFRRINYAKIIVAVAATKKRCYHYQQAKNKDAHVSTG
jgi:hypothetical protein